MPVTSSGDYREPRAVREVIAETLRFNDNVAPTEYDLSQSQCEAAADDVIRALGEEGYVIFEP